MKPKIKIDIVSDIVCPWCYIGKRRLEKALDRLSGAYDFEVAYHPYELAPDIPASGVNQEEYLTKKFGGASRYAELTGRVTQVAHDEGITFNYGKQKVSPNTRKAHSLVQLAASEGKQLHLMELLFRAYFTDGIDLSSDQNLIAIAEKAGIDVQRAQEHLADENGLLQVALAEQEMYKLGISGVPFYIINNRYGVSGAQPTETFIQAFEEIGKETVPAGEACDTDGKNC